MQNRKVFIASPMDVSRDTTWIRVEVSKRVAAEVRSELNRVLRSFCVANGVRMLDDPDQGEQLKDKWATQGRRYARWICFCYQRSVDPAPALREAGFDVVRL